MPRTIDFRGELDNIQYKAVTSDARFIRVIAGAGSGKTRVLTYRFAHLVLEKHISASRILCVTFTNRATEEMQERIAGMLGYQPGTIMTINSLGNKILKAEIHRIGWEEFNVYADETDQIPVLKKILDATEMDPGVISFQKIVKYITRRKSELNYLPYLTVGRESDIEDKIENAKKEENFDEFLYYMYLRIQAEERFIDFNDQVYMPLMMFDVYQEMQDTWANKYSNIMVDEFQDVVYTNRSFYIGGIFIHDVASVGESHEDVALCVPLNIGVVLVGECAP